MQLTYGDLPTADICVKLTSVSFDTAAKNLGVYRLTSEIKGYLEAFDNERRKLLERYGTIQENGEVYRIEGEENIEAYKRALQDLMSTPITDFKADFSLFERDFDGGACVYPQDNKLWLNAAEIGSILNFMNKAIK